MDEEGIDPIFTLMKYVNSKTVAPGETFEFAAVQVDVLGTRVLGGYNHTVFSDATGYAEFPQILYYATDIGETYYYRIYEIPGTDSDYTYDTTDYLAIVDITNDDPTTPAVVTVNMYDEDGNLLSRTVIVDQGKEVRVPQVEFNNHKIVKAINPQTGDDRSMFEVAVDLAKEWIYVIFKK